MRPLLVLALLALSVPAIARRHCPTTIPCETSSSTTSSTSSSSSTIRTTTSTSSTITALCEIKMTPLLVCGGANVYDNWAMVIPSVPVCAGQPIGCNIFFTNASHCNDPNAELGIVWAGLTLDRVVDGVVTATTGQTFPTDNILRDPNGLGYESYPGATGELCSTVIPDCTVGLPRFDPIMRASEVGHQVSIQATYIIQEQANRNNADGGIRTVVTSTSIIVENCP